MRFLLGLLRRRRGSVALMFGLTAAPLLGFAALGVEGGAWYVTKRASQNAADAAAYAGAVQLAFGSDAGTVDYSGKQFAAQNAFCDQGDATAYPGSTCRPLPPGTTQSVQISVGSFANGAFSASGSGNAVRAIVSQRQPPLLASLFLRGNLDIVSEAVAQIQTPHKICILGLTGSPGFSSNGSVELSGGNCTVMSNTNMNLQNIDLDPNSSGWTFGATNGCSGKDCNINVPHNYHMLPATNPFTSLDSMFSAISGGQSVDCSGNLPSAPGYVYKDLTIKNKNKCTFPSNATIFITGTLDLKGTLEGTSVNIVLLSNASMKINGGGTINLTANTSNSQYPALNGVAIYSRSSSVTFNGNSELNIGGVLYFPNADMKLNGTSAVKSDSGIKNCLVLVAKSIDMRGNFGFDTSGCPESAVPKVQVVTLVQ